MLVLRPAFTLCDSMDQTETLERQWAEFRRRRARYFIAGAIAFAMLVAGVKFAVRSGSSTPVAISVVAAIVIIAVLGIPYLKWRCPRCGNPFVSKRLLGLMYREPFARQCVHCKLPIGASHEDEKA